MTIFCKRVNTTFLGHHVLPIQRVYLQYFVNYVGMPGCALLLRKT